MERLRGRVVEWLIRPVLSTTTQQQSRLNSNLVNIHYILNRRFLALEHRVETLENLESKIQAGELAFENRILESINQRISGLEKKLQNNLETQSEMESSREEFIKQMREDIQAYLEPLVDEIAERFEEESASRQSLRASLLSEFQQKINHLQEQWTEALITETISEESWERPDESPPQEGARE